MNTNSPTYFPTTHTMDWTDDYDINLHTMAWKDIPTISPACQSDLDAVVSCVQRDSDCRKCFDVHNIERSWPHTAINLFRGTLAYHFASDPDFCEASNKRACYNAFYPGKGQKACCCLEETHAYMACGYQDGGWIKDHGIADEQCVYRGCEIFDIDKSVYGPSRATIGVLAVGYALLLLGLFYHWYRKRSDTKRGGSNDEKEENRTGSEKEEVVVVADAVADAACGSGDVKEENCTENEKEEVVAVADAA